MAYGSAADLPSITKMKDQIRALQRLGPLVPKSARKQMREAQQGLDHLTQAVDDFFTLLGPRHWIFHDSLSLDAMRSLVDAHPLDPQAAETALVTWYNEEDRLQWMTLRLNRHSPLRARMHLLELALADQQAGRYYAVVHVLLSVMDGFVNDLNPHHPQGLHALEGEDLQAWDSVVGHHQGLSAAHHSFKRGFKKRSDEPVTELYRHGIVHGALTNYNNQVIATKAWNRLFAVADWAASLEAQAADAQKPAEPTLREVLRQVTRTAQDKKALEAFAPQTLGSSDKGFLDHPAVQVVSAFLQAWQRENFGQMSSCVVLRSAQVRPVDLRREYEGHELQGYELVRVEHQTFSVATVHVRLEIDQRIFAPKVRCLLTGEKGPAAVPSDKGRWTLPDWQHHFMTQHTER